MELAPYQASGRFGLGVVFWVPFLVVPAFLLGAIYSAFTVYVPIVGVFTVFACLGVGFATWMGTNLVANWVHSRSPMLNRALGLWFGLLTLYAVWAFFVYFLAMSWGESLPLPLAFDPFVIVAVAADVGENGWYEINDLTPSGIVLYSHLGA